jgi:hypothetical protein
MSDNKLVVDSSFPPLSNWGKELFSKYAGKTLVVDGATGSRVLGVLSPGEQLIRDSYDEPVKLFGVSTVGGDCLIRG